MGQGQEGPAEAVLDRYTKEGGWVFLDNVHLMQVGCFLSLSLSHTHTHTYTHTHNTHTHTGEDLIGAFELRSTSGGLNSHALIEDRSEQMG
jgi:hypothetical protein